MSYRSYEDEWDADVERHIHKHMVRVGMVDPGHPLPPAERPVLELVDNTVVYVDFRNRRARRHRMSRVGLGFPSGGAA